MTLSLPVRELFSKYKKWVRNNPDETNNIEMGLQCLGFFAGRLQNTMIPTVGINTASTLLIFLNDQIIQTPTTSSTVARKIRIWLTVLEHCEILIETSVNQIWGRKPKWVIIGTIQLLKSALRLALLLKCKERLVSSPAIPSLNRQNPNFSSTKSETPSVTSISFKLKRSGRVIRKVEAASSSSSRLWLPPIDDSDEIDEEPDQYALTKQLTGEVLYITRPLAQLASTYRYGSASWKPWMLSLGIDLASLLLLKSQMKRNIPAKEKLEISRRVTLLVMYILRSPFYERHSADRISAFLNAISRTVPLARFIVEPTKDYIPYFQSLYSFTWST